MLQDLVDNAPAEPVMARQVELPPLDEDDTMEMPNEDINMDMILDIPVDIHVEVGQTQASIRDVLKLSSGSVIELDRLAGQPADIIVNGKLIGQGDVVIISENFGIRITKLVKPEKRVDAF
jgi:flagellar motor switch protein FliN/FliY